MAGQGAMTTFQLHEIPFQPVALQEAEAADPRMSNWPVVYLICNEKEIYVGETGHVSARMTQHLQSPKKKHLKTVRLVLDERFNKSACLDLESFLIRLLGGDGKFDMLNLNEGITNREYYQRGWYQETFNEVFGALRDLGFFTRSIPEIENTDLFKLSPYKSLNRKQAVVVNEVMEALAEDLRGDSRSLSVVQGGPGTGKTVVGIFLIKLLRDLARFDPSDEVDGDSVFSDFFVAGNREPFHGLAIALVIPQQSLRKSVRRVFAKSSALKGVGVVSPYELAETDRVFDIVVVDEAHRLTQHGAQAHGTLTKRYTEIVQSLFGETDPSDVTQLDWLRAKSRHLILLLDTEQRVRPIDIDPAVFHKVVEQAHSEKRLHRLETQMRVAGGAAYLDFAQALLADGPAPTLPDLKNYDLRLFDDLRAMQDAIRERDAEHGLARLVAGYAWKWISQKTGAPDIVLDGIGLYWNRTSTDWINSKTALEEVGSIHTVQGYDLNYAGVIIGRDLQLDPGSGKLCISRSNYHDIKGKSNNKLAGKVTTDDDLKQYIINVYRVLLTRGMRGTYIYVVDPALRTRFEQAVHGSAPSNPA